MAHLLVVDDSPTIRKLVEVTFRATPWTSAFAASGLEGVRLAKEVVPDVILLDFVLPDMRGVDVCARLSADPRTKDVPVVLMSAKEESIRSLFKPYPQVVDFIAKPFSAEELVARIRTASADDSGRPRAQAGFTHAQKEAAAKALFAKMSKAFAHIPSWLAQMGTQAPALFFARKILTPDLMNELMEQLLPIYKEVLAKEVLAKAASLSIAPPESATSISGHIKDWPLADLFTLFGASGRTGELRLTRTDGTITFVYWRCGEIVFVTSTNPAGHTGCEGGEVSDVPQGLLASAEKEQRVSGKPVHVTLAEQGALPAACDLRRLLHRVGRRTLVDALDTKDQSFAWRDMQELPPYAEKNARHVTISRNTMPFDGSVPPEGKPTSLHQLTLERLREAPPLEEGAWPTADVVFNRATGFSEKLADLTLTARERRVLTLVDGRVTVSEIAMRAGLDVPYARHIVRCLNDVGLLSVDKRGRPVILIDDASDGFTGSLQSLLAQREEPVPVVRLPHRADVLDAVRRERPRAVILSEETSASDVCDTARTLRGCEELRGVPLLGLLELRAAARAPELERAGFDAVFVKPVVVADLERWLTA